MRLRDFKQALSAVEEIKFILPNGSFVPSHFHVTEVGLITKRFIDCGGKYREENRVSLQLWEANDYDHRLSPGKLIDIINQCEHSLDLENHEIEVEYQGTTIEKYGLQSDGINFQLEGLATDCLAKDNCGIPAESKQKVALSSLSNQCTPGSGCC